MAPRQLLHASDLAFHHPLTGEEMHFRAPLPEDFAAVVAFGRQEEGKDEDPGDRSPN
jgi:23S rRNA pseudouridine1911/1915/1917 synthase